MRRAVGGGTAEVKADGIRYPGRTGVDHLGSGRLVLFGLIAYRPTGPRIDAGTIISQKKKKMQPLLQTTPLVGSVNRDLGRHVWFLTPSKGVCMHYNII